MSHRPRVPDRVPETGGQYVQCQESNWLPAPTGDFLLMLRVYLPGPGF
jgi:hypothetical protein